MRIEELAYQSGENTRRLAFHPRLTVMSGCDADTRRAWARGVLALVSGRAEDADPAPGLPTSLVVDFDGEGEPGGSARHGAEAGGAALDMLLDAAALRADEDPTGEGRELRALRSALATAEAEHKAALARHHDLDQLRERLRRLDDQLATLSEQSDRHRHGRSLLAVARLEAELALLGGGSPSDRREVEAGVAAAQAAEAWRQATRDLAQACAAVGHGARLDPALLALRLSQPTEIPAGLDDLHHAYRSAAERRNRLLAQLRDEAAAVLPFTGTPWARRLARLDPAELWSRAETALAQRSRVVDLALALGDPDGRHHDLVAELDDAHRAVDIAERAVSRSRFPALAKGPKRALEDARDSEREVFERAGFSSWLGFQLRRVEATLEPAAREGLSAAQAELVRAEEAWRALAGDVDPEAAAAVRPEIEALALALVAGQARRGSVEATRRELEDLAEPELAQARDALARVCEPFGVELEDAPTAIAAVTAQAGLARRQARGSEAEEAQRRAEADLDVLLDDAGLPGPTPVATRADIVIAQFGAGSPVPDQGPDRTREHVAAELSAARDRVEALSRPDWNDADLLYELLTGASTPAVPAVEQNQALPPAHLALVEERDQLAGEEARLGAEAPDDEALAERRYELARRLEVATAPARRARIEHAEMALIRRFAHIRGAGPTGGPLPLVVDDALAAFPAEDKWLLLDLMSRLSAASQVLYLTDDDDTVQWAEARHDEGTARLFDLSQSPAVVD